MASMKEIKRRRAAIQSTAQITKAMKLVATVKLQKARTKADASKPYFTVMYQTIASMLEKSENISHKYLKKNDGGKTGVLIITGNRGLAGGYNNAVSRQVISEFKSNETLIYAVGKKGRDTLLHKGFEVEGDFSEIVEEPLYKDAADITKVLLDDYETGKLSEIYVIYTNFKNTVVHDPVLLKLLPISKEDLLQPETTESEGARALMNYSPNEDEVLDAIIPKYISSVIYGGLMQSVASENGARMTAMDSATSNAEELIDKLGLQYNRARQGAITQELTEIVAGANAIE